MQGCFFGLIKLTMIVGLLTVLTTFTQSCSTTPKAADQAKIIENGQEAMSWFSSNVSDLDSQLNSSAGYIIYPGVGQYGLLFGGGKFGQGIVYNEQNQQIGWAYLNDASAGLQVGGQGFKMLVVFQNSSTMNQFKENKLTGSVGATIVAADSGEADAASFTNGVAVYQGAQTGLMAGASVGLDYMRFEAIKP